MAHPHATADPCYCRVKDIPAWEAARKRFFYACADSPQYDTGTRAFLNITRERVGEAPDFLCQPEGFAIYKAAIITAAKNVQAFVVYYHFYARVGALPELQRLHVAARDVVDALTYPREARPM